MRAFLALLILAATSAWADWVKVAENVDTTFYIDPATIAKSGNIRQAAELRDYAKEERDGARSRRSMVDIDCTAEKLRMLGITDYAEPMGRGKVLASREQASDWGYAGPVTGSRLPPRSANATIVAFVCNR